MEGLRAWARELAAIVILGGLLELTLPAGAMRRYAHLALGLLLLLTVLGPVLDLARDPGQWLAAALAVEGTDASPREGAGVRDERVAAVRAQLERQAVAVFLARAQEAATAAAREVPGVLAARATATWTAPAGGPPAVRLAVEATAAAGASAEDVGRGVRRQVSERLGLTGEQVDVDVRRAGR